MEMIKRLMGGALTSDALTNKGFWKSFATEITILFCLFGICVSVLTINPAIPFLKDFKIVNTLKSGENQTKTVQLKASEKIDMEQMVSTTMSYSYADAKNGFYKKQFQFFEKNSKAAAEKKLLSNIPNFLSKRAKNYIRAVLIISEFHQVDPIWVLSVMWTESHFVPSAKSSVGARGLMQIMPGTRKWVYRGYKRKGNTLLVEKTDFNIQEYFPYTVIKKDYKNHVRKLVNIELGIIYLKSLLDTFNDNHTYATVAYNMGPGWTSKRLRNKLPVGTKNHYLDKVQNAYQQIIRKI